MVLLWWPRIEELTLVAVAVAPGPEECALDTPWVLT